MKQSFDIDFSTTLSRTTVCIYHIFAKMEAIEMHREYDCFYDFYKDSNNQYFIHPKNSHTNNFPTSKLLNPISNGHVRFQSSENGVFPIAFS